MSCSRGNNSRKRPQKHQNKTAFKNDLHDTSKKTKTLNSFNISGLCLRCKDIIEWKIKFKKYKPLRVPTKCANCTEKAVKFAYHLMCEKCAIEKNVCAKCLSSFENKTNSLLDNINLLPKPEEDMETLLKQLPERKRRALLRYIKKQNSDDTDPPELVAYFEELMVSVGLSPHDGLSDDDYGSSSDGDF